MIDRLAEAGWPINRVNNGAPPLNPGRYENRGAEIWHGASQVIANLGVILPADERLNTQLTTRKIKFLSDGRLGVESKKDMAKRGLASPDRADAVAGVIAIDAELSASEFDPDGIRRLEAMVKPCKTGSLIPADFGVSWRPAAASTSASPGWLKVWEEPAYGSAYLATFKAGAEGWSVFILRRGDGEKLKLSTSSSAVAARIDPAAARDWDAALLADRIDLLLRWYGAPVIVPDARNALDVLERLKEKGASIYRRPAPAWRDRASSDTTALGWETTERNLPVAVSTLARAIREGSIDIRDETAVRDIRRFTRRAGLDNGDTIALGIGLHCLEAATVLTAPPVPGPPAWGVTMLDTRAAPLANSGACR
jgi:hypothetical protein